MTFAQQKVLLYVEDDRDHAELVLRTLARHRTAGKVLHVEDGEAALDYLGRCGSVDAPRPALVLLDLRLPKVDGIEVLRAVRTTPGLSDIPVVILSTSASDADKARAYEHHVNSYLVKPDAFPQLDELMKRVGEYWMVWNQVADGGP
jgi:CheY-like chemotaxis protein